MDFNSIEAIYAELEKQVKTALMVEAQKIKLAIEDYIILDLYQSYTPQYYERTGTLLNSIEVSPVKKDGDEYAIEIYVKNELHDIPHWKTGKDRTLTEILQEFADGNGYARDGKEIDPIQSVWENECKDVIENLLDYLRRRGFDIS